MAEPGEVDDRRIGRAAGNDDLRLVLIGHFGDLIVIQDAVLQAHAVLDGIEPLAGQVRLGAMGQVSPRIQAHAEDGVARFRQGKEHGLIGLASRARLHIGKLAIEKFGHPLDCQILGNIDILAAAIIAASRIAFGVFVGHDRPLRFQNGARDDVLRGDQFDLVLLAAQFQIDRPDQIRVGLSKTRVEKTVDFGLAGNGV